MIKRIEILQIGYRDNGLAASAQLCSKMNEIVDHLNSIEKEDKQDDYEDEDKSDEELEEDDEKYNLYNVVEQQKTIISDLNDALKIIRKQNESIVDIIKDLIKCDHIYPAKLDIVIKNLALSFPRETEESLYALQSGRTIR